MNNFWQNKEVLITGHTGFKGSWLSLMLSLQGAKISGYALTPSTSPSLFELAGLDKLMSSHIGDIRDYDRLFESILKERPEIIIHMAAQPIVLESYKNPRETYSSNVMGAVNILEAARHCNSIKALVNVTTDKCYENNDGNKNAFAEDCKLGGHDPYSASKACSEIITQSFRKSFFNTEDGPAIASARAGNVIGGGDWAKNRLFPDFFRAIDEDKDFIVRNPNAVRPWQHVLDALNGYLIIAENLYKEGQKYAEPWNIGPENGDLISVRGLVERIVEKWPLPIKYRIEGPDANLHEAYFLALDSDKMKKSFSWKPVWDSKIAVDQTVQWFYEYKQGKAPKDICVDQIKDFYGEI
jgi:CDP-glucose 4,6-dehydratase